MSRSSETVRLDILSALLATSPSWKIPLGVQDQDDAAVLQIDGVKIVIASDFVRGSEFYLFQLGHLSYFDIGYYLIAANLSDIAAMGAAPAALLTVVRYSKGMTDDEFAEVFRGMRAAADAHGAPIVGGDIGGYVADVLSATALGICVEERYLTRKGAKPGDLVFVSGTVGGGIGALTYFKDLRPKQFLLSADEEASLLRFWKRPNPQIDLGLALARCGAVSSCMDVSDGLKASLEQLAHASSVGMVIEAAAVPIVTELIQLAEAAKLDALLWASSASVDFELLFTVSPDMLDVLEAALAGNSAKVTCIGFVTEGDDIKVKYDEQELRPFPGVPWKHQDGDHVRDILAKAGMS